MSVAFGLLILAIMAIMAAAMALFYQDLLQREENRLATMLSDTIGEAVNRVSFSGRYHSQLLIDELQKNQPNIAYIAIRKIDGTVLAQSGTPPAANGDLSRMADMRRMLIDGQRRVAIIDHRSNGEALKEIILPHRAGYGASIAGTIHVVISVAELQADMRRGLTYLLLLGLLLFAGAVALTGHLSRRLGGPVRYMADQLGGILDHAPLLIVIRDRAGPIVDASASYRALPPETAALLERDPIRSDHAPAAIAAAAESFSEIPLRRRDATLIINDEPRSFLVMDFAISCDSRGRPRQLCTIAADQTDQRRAELALRERTAELERSNADLEQFAYVASHDLQEPLRMVASYVTLLSRRYGHILDQDGLDFIGFAREGAERMQRLILDLLDYSRIGRKGSPRTQMAMTTPLQAALGTLGRTISEAGARIDVPAPLPTVFGSTSELTRLWQNLIGNAIKYAHPDRPPVVSISAVRDGENWLFSVADNGIGIDPQYADRIFLIFQRLHARDQYPGSGIGLAICHKIVTQHGGRIWLEPCENGALFRFLLPAG